MSTSMTTSVPSSAAVPATGSSRPGLPVLARLTARLTRARLTSREGETLLYLASVLAYTVATCAALTVDTANRSAQAAGMETIR